MMVNRFLVPVFAILLLTGCSTSRSTGINMATSDIETIETIAKRQDALNLADYEGVALLTLVKGGVGGLGITDWTASVFVKDPVKNIFGPPSFVDATGFSIGLGYAGLNIADCLLLFRKRDAAVKFASREKYFNYSHEASFLILGRKQMTVPGACSFSDGAGLCVGFVELEMLFGGPMKELHQNMYNEGATVEKILYGNVSIPDELKSGLEKLNLLMKNGHHNVSAPAPKAISAETPSATVKPTSSLTEKKPVATETPSVTVKMPTAAIEKPPAATENPPVEVKSPSVVAEKKPVATETPAVEVKSPPAVTEKPPVAMQVQSVPQETSSATVGEDTLIKKLKLLKSARQENLLTEQEYQQKRDELLKGL
jgi:lipid-binding SYLF domain-containing protein